MGDPVEYLYTVKSIQPAGGSDKLNIVQMARPGGPDLLLTSSAQEPMLDLIVGRAYYVKISQVGA